MSQNQNNWRNNKEGRERDGELDEPRDVISNTVGRRDQEGPGPGPGALSMTVTATGIEATGTSSSMSKAINFNPDSASVLLEDPNGNLSKKEELNVASSSSVGKKESPSDTTLQQDLRCPICMDFFIEPTITDCAHVFCHFCINYWFVNRGRSICPQCRNTVERVVPSQNLNAKVEKYVLTHLSKDALEERERVKEIRRRDLNFTIDDVALLDESTVSPYSSSSGDIDDLFWAFTLQQAVPESSGVGVRGGFTATASVWPSATGTNNPSAMSSPSFINSLLSTTNSVDSSQLPSRMDSSTNMHLPANDIQSQGQREGGESLEEGSNREGHLQEMGSTLNQFEYRLDRAQRAYGVLLTAQREMNHQLAHLHSISYRLDRYDRQGVAATAAHHSRSRNTSAPQSTFIQHPLPIPIPDLSVFTSNISQSVNPSLNNSFFEHLTNVGSSRSPHDHDEQDEVQDGQTSNSESNNSSPRLNDRTSARRNSITTPTRIGVGVAGNGWNDPVSNNYHYLDPNAMWYWLSSPYYHHAGNSRFYPPTQSDLNTHNHHHHHQNRQLTMHSGNGQSHSSGCPLHDLNLREQAYSGNSYGRQRHGHLSTNYHFHPIPEAVSSTSIQGETGTRIGEERETCCSSNGNSNSSNVTSSDCREGTDVINSNLLQEFPRTRTRSMRHNRRRRCCERPYQSNQSRSHNHSNNLSLSSHQLDPRSTEFDEEFLEEITSHLADSELAEAIERSLVLDIFNSRDTSTSPGQSSSPNLNMDEDGLVDLTSRTDLYFQHYSHRECEGSRHRSQQQQQQQNQQQSHHDHSHQSGHPHNHQHSHHNSSRQRPLH